MGSKAKSLADHLAAVPDPRKIRGTLAGIPFGGLAWFSWGNAHPMLDSTSKDPPAEPGGFPVAGPSKGPDRNGHSYRHCANLAEPTHPLKSQTSTVSPAEPEIFLR